MFVKKILPIFIAWLGLVAVPGVALAKQSGWSIKTYPETIAQGEDFLVHVQGLWLNGCPGKVNLEITETEINVLAIQGDEATEYCRQTALPFDELFNPLDEVADGIAFPDQITVNYYFQEEVKPQLIGSTSVQFTEINGPREVTRIESGSWVSRDIEFSGLFVEQQGDKLFATLHDYNPYTTFGLHDVWFFTSGKIREQIYIASLYRPSQVVCIWHPCPRSGSRRIGKVYMLLLDRNKLIVRYRNSEDTRPEERVLLPGRHAFGYHRYEFNRSSELAKTEIILPNLEGDWVVGLTTPSIAKFDRFSVNFMGRLGSGGGGLRAYQFMARPKSGSSTSELREFIIQCADHRPIDGGLGCSINSFLFSGAFCDVYFPFDAVGVRRVSVAAQCQSQGDEAPIFEMLRLN